MSHGPLSRPNASAAVWFSIGNQNTLVSKSHLPSTLSATNKQQQYRQVTLDYKLPDNHKLFISVLILDQCGLHPVSKPLFWISVHSKCIGSISCFRSQIARETQTVGNPLRFIVRQQSDSNKQRTSSCQMNASLANLQSHCFQLNRVSL